MSRSFSETGGGGYSFNVGANQAVLGSRSGDGMVTISTLASSVPEPNTWSLILTGFSLLGYAIRRRGTVKANANTAI